MADRVAHGGVTLNKGNAVLHSSEDSLLSPFFGANVPGEKRVISTTIHPCVDLSRTVHACLDDKSNRADYCTPSISRLELCLRDNKGWKAQ
jgi:hypothetical protein